MYICAALRYAFQSGLNLEVHLKPAAAVVSVPVLLYVKDKTKHVGTQERIAGNPGFDLETNFFKTSRDLRRSSLIDCPWYSDLFNILSVSEPITFQSFPSLILIIHEF